MDAYIYRAALYCEDCAESIGKVCHVEHHGGNINNLCDSECTPIGPHPFGGGEADTPQHCDTCGLFLENPLTDDGIKYTRDEIAFVIAEPGPSSGIIDTWRTFYADALAG